MATKRQEDLLQQIKNLEIEIATVKSKITKTENEEAIENYKKNSLDVRKINLNDSIQFYQKYLEKMDKKLSNQEANLTKLSAINEYFDKLLETYREKYFQYQNTYEKSISDTDSETNVNILQQQTQNLNVTIEENSAAIKSLLKDLQYET